MMELEISQIVSTLGNVGHAGGELPLDANLFDLGMSSYNAVQVMLALEERYGIQFPDELLSKEHFSSIRKLTAAVNASR
jgi:D-alanine--poly(phosphoribitol) ligase subunit 2